jgi:hypothetical protein
MYNSNSSVVAYCTLLTLQMRLLTHSLRHTSWLLLYICACVSQEAAAVQNSREESELVSHVPGDVQEVCDACLTLSWHRRCSVWLLY